MKEFLSLWGFFTLPVSSDSFWIKEDFLLSEGRRRVCMARRILWGLLVLVHRDSISDFIESIPMIFGSPEFINSERGPPELIVG